MAWLQLLAAAPRKLLSLIKRGASPLSRPTTAGDFSLFNYNQSRVLVAPVALSAIQTLTLRINNYSDRLVRKETAQTAMKFVRPALFALYNL